ncbi:MAG: PKD-like domain-containing protein, partial [Flavobacteriales bacterium]
MCFVRISYGQGDDCLSATYLPNTSNYCSPNAAFSNVGASPSLLSLPTCWNSNITQDVWFQFIATGTDVLISINGNGSGGSMTAPNIALYNGSCTGLMFELGCTPSATGIGSTQLYEGALAPGTTYYIRVASNPTNQGTFSLCINGYTPTTNPGADCGGAAYLCNQNPVSVASLGGGGLDNDEPEPGTCLDVWGPDEGNSSWFKWTCETSGTLTFDITPINPNDDIDFILYQLSSINACGPRTPIRCNSSSCLNTVGSTGLNLVDLDFDEWPNCDPGENAYCQYINMVAGVSYAILINNFSASTGFTLSFNVGNTNNPGTFLGPHPILNHTNTSICQGSSVTFNATGSTNVAGGLNWIFPNGANSTTANGIGPFTINYSNPGNFMGILNGFDTYGCEATQYVNIQVFSPPILINPPTQNICQNSSTSIPLMNVIPTGTSVQWTVSQNPFISGASNGSGTSINQQLSNSSNQVQSIIYTITAINGPCTVVSTCTVFINPTILPTFNSVSPICAGGNLSALPTTSLNNVSGTWSPALNNQATTTYTFTPTAGQCAATTTLTITVNPMVVPTFDPVSPICAGGNLSTLPTTSLNNINGTWSPVLNNQATTTYSFTPTAGQCTSTTTLTITVNPMVVPTFDPVSPICAGGNLSALPTTSLNNITGTWSPALNNQATTTYTFTSSFGQCAVTTTLTITVNPVVVPTFNSVSPICIGGNLSALPTTSLNNINGTWSPALNNQGTSTYTFIPTAGQCAVTTTLTITVNPVVVPTFNSVSPICAGGNLGALPTTSLNNIT